METKEQKIKRLKERIYELVDKKYSLSRRIDCCDEQIDEIKQELKELENK